MERDRLRAWPPSSSPGGGVFTRDVDAASSMEVEEDDEDEDAEPARAVAVAVAVAALLPVIAGCMRARGQRAGTNRDGKEESCDGASRKARKTACACEELKGYEVMVNDRQKE